MSCVDAGATEIDAVAVARLVSRQFPHWADRAVTAVPSAGAGNVLFRLGDDLLARLPRHPGSVAAIDVERSWLPRLAAFPMNLLADRGKLVAVIDFDLMGVGDPAIDMVPAWTLLTAETRPLFRTASGVDDDTWIRGRGWALKAGLGAVHKYPAGHQQAVVGRFSLTHTIADYRRTL